MHSRVNLWKAKHANSHMQKIVHMLFQELIRDTGDFALDLVLAITNESDFIL